MEKKQSYSHYIPESAYEKYLQETQENEKLFQSFLKTYVGHFDIWPRHIISILCEGYCAICHLLQLLHNIESRKVFNSKTKENEHLLTEVEVTQLGMCLMNITGCKEDLVKNNVSFSKN